MVVIKLAICGLVPKPDTVYMNMFMNVKNTSKNTIGAEKSRMMIRDTILLIL